MSILKIENLKKSYKDTQAVKNVSFSVEKGDIYGVLGPNGAGKSTTINSIVGFIKPDSGSIVFEDKYSINEWKRNIGYIPQELAYGAQEQGGKIKPFSALIFKVELLSIEK